MLCTAGPLFPCRWGWASCRSAAAHSAPLNHLCPILWLLVKVPPSEKGRKNRRISSIFWLSFRPASWFLLLHLHSSSSPFFSHFLVKREREKQGGEARESEDHFENSVRASFGTGRQQMMSLFLCWCFICLGFSSLKKCYQGNFTLRYRIQIGRF